MKKLIAATAALLILVGCGGDDNDVAGGETGQVTVPDLVGLVLSEAEDVADSVGLEVEASDASPDDRMILRKGNWTVASQEPAPGTEVASGAVVTVLVTNELDSDSTLDEDTNESESDPALDGDTNEGDADPAFDGEAYARQIEERVSFILGYDEITEACDFDDPSWHCYYESLTGTDSDSRIDVHLGFPGDISDDEQREAAADARLHIFNFVGEELPELDTIVSYNSNGLDIGTTRRDEVPLLNRD